MFSTTATKRDAKAYLSRYKAPSKPALTTNAKPQAAADELSGLEKSRSWRLSKSGVNLGGLYGSTRAIGESPVFIQQPLLEKYIVQASGPLHVAVVKIRGLGELDDKILKGVALTLAQLARLGLLSAVVVDGGSADSSLEQKEECGHWRERVMKQCFRLANAIADQSETGARVVDQALGVKSVEGDIPSNVAVKGRTDIRLKELLMTPMRHGMIPLIPPIAYTHDSRIQRVQADDVVLALTREFAGLTSPSTYGRTPHAVHTPGESTTLDKVIVLDPLGGLPARSTRDNSHVFVNLDQDYQDVRDETLAQPRPSRKLKYNAENHSDSGSSNQLTRQVEAEASAPHGVPSIKIMAPSGNDQNTVVHNNRHTQNLDLIKNCLTLLPPSSSALLTTPSEAASSALFCSSSDHPGPGVGTRAKRNPLIHNLLTDKPIISSSLPTARLTATTSVMEATPATFFKRGMPLTIIPDPKLEPWRPPGPGGSSLRLESDPRIDFPRLLHLIEDSFGRPLEVHHYLNRIKNRIAGIIIAGEYEGGAILTWELPPPVHGLDCEQRPPVPYLDKFAVLRRSQGSGGVADIVFNAMVRTCLPDGVVWRSRQNNPVNKWYFERSVGTWKLPGSQWCMFWTGDDVDFDNAKSKKDERERERRWQDYAGVCGSIEASWEDRRTKAPD